MSIKTISTLGLVVTVFAGVAIAASALPASAATTANVVHHSSGSAVAGQQFLQPATTPITPHEFLAGWLSDTPSGLASASATFRIPVVTCPTFPSTDFGWGVFAVPTSGDLYTTSQANVQVICDGGPPRYYISVFTPVEGVNFTTASPGDRVVTTLSENGTTTVATTTDLTAGTSVTSTSASAFDTAENTGSYNWDHPGQIPSFAPKVTFNKCKVNGAPIGNTATSRLDMEGGTDVQVSTSALNRTGDSFSVMFRHSL